MWCGDVPAAGPRVVVNGIVRPDSNRVECVTAVEMPLGIINGLPKHARHLRT